MSFSFIKSDSLYNLNYIDKHSYYFKFYEVYFLNINNFLE